MENHIDAARDLLAEVSIADVAGDNLNLLQAVDFFEPSPAVEGVVKAERANPGSGRDQLLDEMGADESVSTRNEYTRVLQPGHGAFQNITRFSKGLVIVGSVQRKIPEMKRGADGVKPGGRSTPNIAVCAFDIF